MSNLVVANLSAKSSDDAIAEFIKDLTGYPDDYDAEINKVKSKKQSEFEDADRISPPCWASRPAN